MTRTPRRCSPVIIVCTLLMVPLRLIRHRPTLRLVILDLLSSRVQRTFLSLLRPALGRLGAPMALSVTSPCAPCLAHLLIVRSHVTRLSVLKPTRPPYPPLWLRKVLPLVLRPPRPCLVPAIGLIPMDHPLPFRTDATSSLGYPITLLNPRIPARYRVQLVITSTLLITVPQLVGSTPQPLPSI